MKEICLVVPTIRAECMRDFVDRWDLVGLFQHVDLVVVEDNPERTFDLAERWTRMAPGSGNLVHFDWRDIEDSFGDSSWIIPRRSDTVRSYGYWWAHDRVEYPDGKNELKYKFIMTLDDDCYPCTDVDGLRYDGGAFVAEHIKWLTKRTRWQSTLNEARPRGLPYKNVGELTSTAINHGLWTNVLDYDALHQLANARAEKFSFDNRIVPAGLYFPMCGMNVMWKREATVLMYHMLMGQLSDPEAPMVPFPNLSDDHDAASYHGLRKLPFDRFGDIWCGIVAKKICDARGLTMSTGMPYIRHERASDPFKNLVKEAPGIGVNEMFWQFIDSADNEALALGALADAYQSMARHIKDGAGLAGPEFERYFLLLGEAMVRWSDVFVSP